MVVKQPGGFESPTSKFAFVGLEELDKTDRLVAHLFLIYHLIYPSTIVFAGLWVVRGDQYMLSCDQQLIVVFEISVVDMCGP